jgi:hypothetical protein
VSRSDPKNELAPLTAAYMARFYRNAPAALARRGSGFVASEFGRALALLLTGAIPLVGMLAYGWSASELLVFLVVGSWIGIACDLVKYLALPTHVRRGGETYYDDWHVWVVASALRRGEETAPRSHLAAKYEPALGVLVDFVCGGIGTALICVALAETGFSFRTELWQNGGLLKSVAILATYEVTMTAWEIARHKLGGDASGAVKVALGMRGLGLFLLLFVVVMIREALGDDGALARSVMLAVNGAIVLTACFNAIGFLLVRGETNWLREYLQQSERKRAD